jgi:hypothetical protein
LVHPEPRATRRKPTKTLRLKPPEEKIRLRLAPQRTRGEINRVSYREFDSRMPGHWEARRGRRMNWDALAAAAETIGAIAVIVTIGYLAVQIRQNTNAVRNSAAQQLLEGIAELNQFLGSDPQITDLWWRGTSNPDSLSEQEWNRFIHIASTMIRRMELMFLNHRQGLMDPQLWEGMANNMERWFSTPGMQRWFSEFGAVVHAEFREYVAGHTTGGRAT